MKKCFQKRRKKFLYMKMQQQQKIPVIQFAYLLHSAQTPCVAELETLYKNDYTYVLPAATVH